jgi:pyruvate kinase
MVQRGDTPQALFADGDPEASSLWSITERIVKLRARCSNYAYEVSRNGGIALKMNAPQAVKPTPTPSAEHLVTLPSFPGLTIDQFRSRYERATKIVATLGPKTANEEKIGELLAAGVNVFRLNFSHGTHEQHSDVLAMIRAVSKRLNVVVGVLQDLCGPKTRIGTLSADTLDSKRGDLILLKKGAGPFPNENGMPVISTELFSPQHELKAGQKVYLADARFELAVHTISEAGAILEVIRGGKLRSKVGIAVPDSDLKLPAYSEKDLKDLDWGIQHHVDYVALSFVNSEEDVKGLRAEMKERGGDIPIIAKIERKGALSRIEEICGVSDGVMVARGDLGVDIPVWEVPRAQLKITAAAQRKGIPVIVATQMLTSMVLSDQPTRADVTDVFNVAQLGADAVMLSEETAIGEYPVEAVSMMAKATLEGQQEFDTIGFRNEGIGARRLDLSPAETNAFAAAEASMGTRYHAIIVCSNTGESARLVAKYRPEVPVYGVSDKPAALRRMALYRGVNPLRLKPSETAEQERERAFRVVAQRYFEVNPDKDTFGAILVNGSRPGVAYSASMMELREITRGDLDTLLQ